MFLGDLASIEEFTRSLHLAALVTCAFLVLGADLTAARSAFRSLAEAEFKRLHRYHSLLTKGLVVFWITGLFLIWRGTGFDLEQFSPKLTAKVLVVTLLTMNALAIGRFALPYFEGKQGMTLGQFNLGVRVRLTGCAALSSASWISAFCLGAIPWLKTASVVELVNFLGPIYTACLVGAGLVALLSPHAKPQQAVLDTAPPVLGTTRRLSQSEIFAGE